MVGSEPKKKPQLIDKKLYNLRIKLAKEELKEYKEACIKKDIVEVADALGDQLYILLGTILEHGMENIIEKVFNEIHDSNMTKFYDGKPVFREDGKLLKGINYRKPNIKSIFNDN